jgi:hypothetical protein
MNAAKAGEIVDVDDQDTWPFEVRRQVGEWARRYTGSTAHAGDLALSLEDEPSFRSLFAGHLLRAYHCTRLLRHEVTSVRVSGLQPLSAATVRERIERAHEAGALTLEQAERLLQGQIFGPRGAPDREGQVCLVLSKRAFRHDPDGLTSLLRTWGGEGIYRSPGAKTLRGRLQEIGTSAVVQACIDITGSDRHLCFPALHRVFVGGALGLSDAWADLLYRAPVPGSCVEKIWVSGEPEYEALW